MIDEQPEYRIVDARYAKGQKVVQPSQAASRTKTRAARLAEQLGRWVHRSHGYTMSPTKANLFKLLFAEGWTGNVFSGGFTPPNDTVKTLKTVREVQAYRAAHNQGRKSGSPIRYDNQITATLYTHQAGTPPESMECECTCGPNKRST